MFFMRQTHGCPIKGLIIRVFGDPYGFYTFFCVKFGNKMQPHSCENAQKMHHRG